MSRNDPPVVENWREDDFTCITFEPDLKKFHMRSLDLDTIGKKQSFNKNIIVKKI
jgi:hypothetical protein